MNRSSLRIARALLALGAVLAAQTMSFGWAGVGTRGADLTNSNTKGHGKITIDDFAKIELLVGLVKGKKNLRPRLKFTPTILLIFHEQSRLVIRWC